MFRSALLLALVAGASAFSTSGVLPLSRTREVRVQGEILDEMKVESCVWKLDSKMKMDADLALLGGICWDALVIFAVCSMKGIL